MADCDELEDIAMARNDLVVFFRKILDFCELLEVLHFTNNRIIEPNLPHGNLNGVSPSMFWKVRET
jgi:hypothetical protein